MPQLVRFEVLELVAAAFVPEVLVAAVVARAPLLVAEQVAEDFVDTVVPVVKIVASPAVVLAGLRQVEVVVETADTVAARIAAANWSAEFENIPVVDIVAAVVVVAAVAVIAAGAAAVARQAAASAEFEIAEDSTEQVALLATGAAMTVAADFAAGADVDVRSMVAESQIANPRLIREYRVMCSSHSRVYYPCCLHARIPQPSWRLLREPTIASMSVTRKLPHHE